MKRSKDITPLELSVGSLLCTFMEYQDADGKLTKETFCKCLTEQMPSFDAVRQHLLLRGVFMCLAEIQHKNYCTDLKDMIDDITFHHKNIPKCLLFPQENC